MKKFTSVMVAALLMLGALSACSSNSEETTAVDASPVAVGGQETVQTVDSGDNSSGDSNTSVTATAYEFVRNGAVVVLGTNPVDVVDTLGAHETYETPSCAYQGTDYSYDYGSFVINTTPDPNGNDVVVSIMLLDDTISTSNGLYVGMSADDVKAVMGEATNTLPGGLEYIEGSKILTFILVDGVVGEIDYTYINE